MKKLWMAVLFLISCTVSFAQNQGKSNNEITPVPNEVKNSFHRDFPTAENEKWEKESGNYEANFNVGNTAMSAVYTKSGYRKEVEKEIEENKLPPSVFEYILKKYPGSKLKTVSQITTDKAVITYETEIIRDNKTIELIFDANGKFKKK